MYRKSLPKCVKKGSYEPVLYGHLCFTGAVPHKCSTCIHLFEGECTRALDKLDHLLRLDYESCHIAGSTEPIAIEVINEDSVFVPKKCVNCEHITKSDIYGYFCSYEKDIWKDFPRDLDWGDWKPDYPLISIRRYQKRKTSLFDSGLAVINRELILLLQNKEKIKAMKLYRSLNKIDTIKETMDDINEMMEKLNNN
ncbi:hypothetical protein [Aquimarina rhabdastrellae]